MRAATDAIDPALTALWRGGPPAPEAWPAGNGWDPAVRQLAEVAAGFGRPVPAAYGAGAQAEGRSWLGTARRP
ncbi:hypothetical protein [Streptomyces sp. NPDC101237]|uniref:hypothetical protein n=1 Tax=Streptomyces sp. NPDC101237 TaxID=3366139 RepID=UPI00380E4342